MLRPSRFALFLLALCSVACTGVVDAKDEAGNEASLSSRRKPGTFAVAAVPAPAPDPAPGPNLLVNGGFEDALAGWTWSLNASAVASPVHTGARALEVGPAAGGIGQDLAGRLSPGTSYHLECYARVGDAAEWSAIMLQLTNAAGTIVLDRSAVITTAYFEKYAFDFTVPLDAVAGNISLWKNAGVSLLAVDDVSLFATAAGPSPAPASIPSVAGVAYPFGSHLMPYVAGILPTVSTQSSEDALLRSQYDSWKAAGVAARCGGYVVVFNASYATVSEGAGYGLLLAVLMAGHDAEARTLFDGLFHVVRSHPAYSTGYPALMDWRINADCSSGGDGWNAMDGDLDIAMALLMADKQWGSSGGVNYKAEALAVIAALKAFNMTSDGRTKGLPSASNNRTSDYMITHFKAFRRATGDVLWDAASDKAFYLLDLMQTQFAPATGLVPDFVINTGTSPAPSPGFVGDGNANEGFYYWNACRIPWRLASDYVTSGDSRSQRVTGKMMDFLNATTGGNPDLLSSGYKLDGTSLNYNPDYVSPSFAGPAAAGAMVDSRFQPFLNSLWTWNGAHLAHGYYDTELQLLSLIVASGNWWNP